MELVRLRFRQTDFGAVQFHFFKRWWNHGFNSFPCALAFSRNAAFLRFFAFG
jgi:hypothetical protein